MRASSTREPICQHQDVFGHGRKGPDLFLRVASLIHADEASDDQLVCYSECIYRFLSEDPFELLSLLRKLIEFKEGM
jgi:hypothetical protein